ncbi:isoleucine--tRNA ligase [Mycoplasma tauri]|uniref:Isoleucine--tRNA ligase n=1 Tax=Mycoplasma tauri TaxID=547987 RepID=A0A953NGY4_9MOLU|nr:isoleucine--tRNA ligase [Mycoplasma tauri]MBZ4195491.1 isoleucine--tRNA ligase [Mycoplasma tauri]MBZ4203628.1 isoleucine--tRNA ligase [Mycoplasma tauri]MBZ4204160.1 isoleucine--tRNA ligase [Mycoplasma tauri]MBZ4212558.1 isoleucine--tRNA ligase [Mycoplasma tauri]QSB07293.1 isoleucine--tRNA ligase [Mycoplasma tauri]
MQEKNYKDTLNMPKTDFEMRANLVNKEPEFREMWLNKNIYQKILEKNKNNQTFILHDGPPYANGNIHIGHALNKILKDIVVRYKSMWGFYAPYVPGWDTHGLPIELKMLTEAKLNFKNISPLDLRKKASDYADIQVQNQISQFKELQLLTDFSKIYITKDPHFEANQLRLFKKMILDGLIYKGLKPVYWSPSSQTALAEAEVEYHEIDSPSIFVSFKITDSNGSQKIFDGDNLVIWTTTPWTLLANSGIAVGEKFNYCRFEYQNNFYIVARDLFEKVTEVCGMNDAKIVSEFKAHELIDIKYRGVLNNLICPVVIGHHVTLESGSGLVHIAPLFGEDDFQIGVSNSLEEIMHVKDDGVLNEQAGKFEGHFYEKSNELICDELLSKSALLAKNIIRHSYPHDWRTHKPILFRGTPQWFVSIDKIKPQLINELENIKAYPEWAKKRLMNMIIDRKDWTISRQRTWGVPIIVFYDEDDKPIINAEIFDYVINLVEEHGSDIWWEKETDDLLPKEYRGKGYTREMDIMDVWFDSGSSSISAIIDENIKPPYDLYLEGSDQYRGWFNSSLINSVAYSSFAPYKQLLSHGFVLDSKGEKMSKSKGNVIDPLKVIKKYGADILRLWVSNSEYTNDINISDDIIKQNSEYYRKIRNTIKFLLGNLNGFKYNPSLKRNGIHEYIYNELEKVKKQVYECYDEYNFSGAIKLIIKYIIELSSFYLNITKDILYVEEINSNNRLMTLTNFYEITDFLIKAIAPIMPTTAEDAYSYFNKEDKKESVFLDNFEDAKEVDEKLLKLWDEFFDLKDQINILLENATKSGLIKRSNEAKITINSNSEFIKSLDLKQLLMVGLIEFGNENKVDVFESQKCLRCWNHLVSSQIQNDLCPLCHKIISNIKESSNDQ